MRIDENDITLIMHAVTPWPPSSWASSFSGEDLLYPNTSTAVIVDVSVRGDDIRLSVKDHNRDFSTAITVRDVNLKERVIAALGAAKGKPFSKAGEIEI